MLDRSTIRGKHLTPLQSAVLCALRGSRKSMSMDEIAIAVYGKEDVERRLRSLRATVCVMCAILTKAQFISTNFRRSVAEKGSRTLTVFCCTQAGLAWLEHHPEANVAYTARATRTSHTLKSGHRNKREAGLAPVASFVPPAPLNLRKYAHRPLPLRVRKACRMPAHFWR